MSDWIRRFVPPADAESQWREFERVVTGPERDYFDGIGPITGARAPGRLDVLGGVADYSGSLVLEMPIGQAAFVALQWRDDRTLRIRSMNVEADGIDPEVRISLDDIVDSSGDALAESDVRERLTANPKTRWAAYIAGCFYVVLKAYGHVSEGKADSYFGSRGANILLQSDVPLGAGVSSSAAIEVAAMLALSEAAGIHPSDLTLAAWCQRVENKIVGAPCGIMDQVTCAMGRDNSLLVLRCQPHDVLGNQTIPPGWRFVGLDSGVKHSVGGSHYTNARVGAFMGLKIIQLESGGKLLENYLCKMDSVEFGTFRDQIPEEITGAEYQRLYGLLPDTVTRVDPAQTYRPRACAEHPILENERAKQMSAIMQVASMPEAERDADFSNERLIEAAGVLMYGSHASYGDRLDLGSEETDLLVRLIRECGPTRGLYGARITGGGSGGTVAVLCRDNVIDTDNALIEVCEEYHKRTGVAPRPIIGSSPGAIQFGSRLITRG